MPGVSMCRTGTTLVFSPSILAVAIFRYCVESGTTEKSLGTSVTSISAYHVFLLGNRVAALTEYKNWFRRRVTDEVVSSGKEVV